MIELLSETPSVCCLRWVVSNLGRQPRLAKPLNDQPGDNKEKESNPCSCSREMNTDLDTLLNSLQLKTQPIPNNLLLDTMKI